jgi:hypothetical protein
LQFNHLSARALCFDGRKKRMKKWNVVGCLVAGGLLALAAGCSKTENPAPSTKEADRPSSAANAEPTPTPEKQVPQTTNVAVATPDTAKTTLDTAAKSADSPVKVADATVKPTATPVTPVTEVTPKTADAANPPVQAQTTLASLSQDQMVQGLKDALAEGLQQAIAKLGHDGGFLTNAGVKIPMPEKLQKVETALRAMKQEKLADEFVTTMNHAAEQAVPEAASVFADALKQMTIEDAKAILSGPTDAATQYFQRTTQTNLYAKFYPIVQKATEKTGVTAAYKTLMEKANVGRGLGSFGSALGDTLLGKDTVDIDAYVTSKAMNGLFKMVAAEEQQIRQNPAARTTAMLQTVFGALKK